MKKIVLFCVPPNCGGAERISLTIAKLLDLSKYEIKIVIIGRSKGEIVDFIPHEFEVIHVNTINIWDFTTFKLIRLFKRMHPHIVFCSLMYLNTRVIMAAKIVGNIKIIIRNNIGFYRMRFDNSFLIRHLYPKADEIILQTDEMKSEIMHYVHLDSKKLHVIFNPIDIESINKCLVNAFNPFDVGYINYVFVGRIAPCKGLDILIPSFAALLKEKPQCRLYLIGKIENTNSYYLKLKEQIKNYKIENFVIWTNFTHNPYRFIKYADCFVLPSRVEGLPNVLLDAMYLKVPVVATRSVPVIDRIVCASRGYVVDVEDAQALKDAMLKAIDLKIVEDYHQGSNDELIRLFA